MAGDVVIPATMPLICELLQFDPAHRETTIRKAEAIERLCGPCALPAPTRLAAIEFACVARTLGLMPASQNTELLSFDRLWFPVLDDALFDLRQAMHAGALESLAKNLPDVDLRRRAESLLETVDWGAALMPMAPEIAERVGIPVEGISDAVVPFLKGELSSLDASRRMLSGISEPVLFVKMYFEQWGPMGTLPDWVRNAGLTVSNFLRDVKARCDPLRSPVQKKQARVIVGKLKPNFRAVSLELARMARTEFGLSDKILNELAAREDGISTVSSAQIAAAALEAYTLQVIGVTTGGAKIEDSFGGDLLHAFYLPYVDIWRGDKRMSAALRQALPAYRDRIGGTLAQLPKLIERKLVGA